jgi:tetratricopeptide (TPR) repeat protein
MGARSGHLAPAIVIALAAAGLPVPSATAAEPSAPQSVEDASSTAVALLLFRQGRTLLEAKDYAGAAAKFEESLRLDPGGGTQLNLALAYELDGRTATAWFAFNEALRMARRDRRLDRVEEAQAHIDGLGRRLSRLRVVLPEATRVAGLEVRCDGVVLGEPSWNTDVPVDPGEHRVEVTAPDKKPRKAMVTLGSDADRQEVVVAVLADQPRPVVAAYPEAAASTAHGAGASSDGATRGRAEHRAGGFVALAAAGLLAGAGVMAWRVHEDNLVIYDDDNRCLAEAGLTRAAQCGDHARAADVALGLEIGAFATAGISATLGVWLLSMSPSRSRSVVAASCAPSAALGIVCRGTF